jgi:hypothetical protein
MLKLNAGSKQLHIVKDIVVKLSIHPYISPVIYPWMASYREENLGRNKYAPPPLCACVAV